MTVTAEKWQAAAGEKCALQIFMVMNGMRSDGSGSEKPRSFFCVSGEGVCRTGTDISGNEADVSGNEAGMPGAGTVFRNRHEIEVYFAAKWE